jgi:hypothetical protein
VSCPTFISTRSREVLRVSRSLDIDYFLAGGLWAVDGRSKRSFTMVRLSWEAAGGTWNLTAGLIRTQAMIQSPVLPFTAVSNPLPPQTSFAYHS